MKSNTAVKKDIYLKEDRILTIDKLTEDALKSFINNEVCAIRVPHYTEEFLCDKLADQFLKQEGEEYSHEIREGDKIKYIYYGVKRIGVAFNTTYNHPVGSPEWERYYKEALEGTRFVRNVAYPYLSPIDHVRLELDELWTYGANIANFEGKKMFAGIVRITLPKKTLEEPERPHCDSVPDRFVQLKSQYAANIYLSMPEEGGDLEMWDREPLPINEIDNENINKDWRNEGLPYLSIKPKKGDLFLINTRRPHSIKGFQEGTRVSLQFFFGLTSDNRIVIWN